MVSDHVSSNTCHVLVAVLHAFFKMLVAIVSIVLICYSSRKMNDDVLGTVVVAGTTSGICFLSTACCCLHSHHYIHQHSATSQQSDAMASLAHKLVISPADMPPTVCRGYYSGEHVW